MKKYLVASIVAIMAFVITAFAASLSVDAGTLQAGEAAIDKCIAAPDESIGVSYGTPSLEDGVWLVNSVTLDHAGNCEGLTYTVIVAGANGLETDPVSGIFGEGEATLLFVPFAAEDATDVHIAIRNAS
jgi:hypothetical protein